jgi:diguanylate cyclase (GGDEF)-like protein
MNEDFFIPRVYLRSDSMTGAENLLAFFEWLLIHTAEKPIAPFTLISIKLIGLKQLNVKHGYAAGDAALRWVTLCLTEEAGAKVYRISADEFVGLLVEGSRDDHAKLCEKVRTRMHEEAALVKLDPPAARIAMIYFSSLEKTSPEDILGIVYGALLDLKINPENTFRVFDEDTNQSTTITPGLINDMVLRLVSLGAMLDRSQKLASIDSISGLPNMKAAEEKCETMIQSHQENKKAFALLLIDGDDLRKYNKISYLEGDKMIARLGGLLRDAIRPEDFLARWRTGDEFVILVENTSVDRAVHLGNRLLTAVSNGSQDWVYPITISIGVSGYPEHGNTIDELIHKAELGLSKAKDQGKNQVYLH